MKKILILIAVAAMVAITACQKTKLTPETANEDDLTAQNKTSAVALNIVTTTYYVDNVNGNDNHNGTSTATAWKTIS